MRTAENNRIGDRLADRDVGRDMLTSTREPPIPVPSTRQSANHRD